MPWRRPNSSAFYGVYEQQLADELAQLLKNGPPARATKPHAITSAAVRQLPQSPAELTAPPRIGPNAGPITGSVEQQINVTARPFVAARRPDNDFARSVETDDDPLPMSWRHEFHPPEPSWYVRQMRAGMIGLGAGLIVVLPAVAVLSGKLDPWLKGARPASTVQHAIVMPEAHAVATERPAVTAALAVQSHSSAATIAPGEPAATIDANRLAAVQSPPSTTTAEPENRPAPSAPVPVMRSIGSVEAFPPAVSRSIPDRAPAPPAPTHKPLDEAAGLLLLGQTLVKEGDVAGARDPLARAANLGSAEAIAVLGETFDPNMLAAWGARDVRADASTARLFYGRAAAAGVARAKARLEALN